MPILGVLYPLSEFAAWYLFISRYSFWDAVLLCFSTGLVGIFIVSMHAKALLADLAMAAPRAGQVGGDFRKLLTQKSLNRLLIMIGGLFLFIPGLVAKFIGTLLIFPGARHLALWILQAKFAESLVQSGFQFVVKNKVWGADMPADIVDVTPKSVKTQAITAGDDPNSH